jgi:hypothetical protein
MPGRVLYAGIYEMRTVILPGTDPFCVRLFPTSWVNGVAVEGQPVTWWRAYTNPTQFVEPTNPTQADPQWGLIPNGLQAIHFFHQFPFHTIYPGEEVTQGASTVVIYNLPDGTTRTPGNKMSAQAWGQIGAKIFSDEWPTANVIP